ncbi:MAG TPA: short-chain dehydrogenase [Oceanospirillaceae bacterium]|nr:short-chain dehydrogenase [Oceanospirillaceae bacterium]|tara:strand:+ start:590 stop:1273 length:684 start_codon:yes stop_codon:yes gene_type:complete
MPNVLITGANRGIGLQLTKHYIEAGWEVIATYRNAEGNEALQALASPQLTLLQADVTNDEGISKIASYFQGQGLDLLINNAGIYGPRDQTFGKVERQAWREILEVNTISPMMLAQSLADSLAQNKGTLAIISSKVGSIDDNTSGNAYMYRSSKTAVNQVIKCLSIDLGPRDITVVSLHPGWVRTDMGGPNGSIDVVESVAGLTNVIAHVSADQNGHFINYDGSPIPW